MNRSRLLLVDDDRRITDTLHRILAAKGFDVTVTNSVSDAIRHIARQQFEILITDLNIGEPGDGFTVVSALRRSHPDAVALIITGYPAFDAALRAIRDQVDDFLVKPVHPEELVGSIERVIGAGQRKHHPLEPVPVWKVIRESKNTILEGWRTRMRAYADQVGQGDMPEAELTDHLQEMIEDVCRRVEKQDATLDLAGDSYSLKHGEIRRARGVEPTFLLKERAFLRQEIIDIINRNFMRLTLSTLFSDLSMISEVFDEQLAVSMQAYLSAPGGRQ